MPAQSRTDLTKSPRTSSYGCFNHKGGYPSHFFPHPIPTYPLPPFGTSLTIGRYMPYQWSGEPSILPLHLPVPLLTYHTCPYLLPNPSEPCDSSNLFTKDLPDRAPINNNRCIPSNYPQACSLIVEVSMVDTHGTNTYNTQFVTVRISLVFIYYTRIRTRYEPNGKKPSLWSWGTT